MTTDAEKDWLIGICRSEASGIGSYSNRIFHGSEDNVKKLLVDFVKKSRSMDREHFDSGTTKVTDIAEDAPGRFSAYSYFSGYHIKYVAYYLTPEELIMLK